MSEAQGLALLSKLSDELGTLKNELLALEVDIVGQVEVVLSTACLKGP